MQLSANFTFDELTGTDVRALLPRNREKAMLYVPKLRVLCTELLQPIRANFACPIFVSSGFRFGALNAVVGGDPFSQHKVGEAADFNVANHFSEAGRSAVFQWIWLDSGLKFRQLLIEGGCIHISLPKGNMQDGEVAQFDVTTKRKVILQKSYFEAK